LVGSKTYHFNDENFDRKSGSQQSDFTRSFFVLFAFDRSNRRGRTKSQLNDPKGKLFGFNGCGGFDRKRAEFHFNGLVRQLYFVVGWLTKGLDFFL